MQIACVANYSSWFWLSVVIHVFKASVFQLGATGSQSLGGMEKNMISEINIEPPLTSFTLFRSLLKFIGSALVRATSLTEYNVLLWVGILGKK